MTLLTWELIIHKKNDHDAKKKKIYPFIEQALIQNFYTFLLSLAIIKTKIKKQFVFDVITMYPETLDQTKLCLHSHIIPDFTGWQKMLKLPQIANNFRDRLIFEDISILSNIYPNFTEKISLKNDTPAELAINYLKKWS